MVKKIIVLLFLSSVASGVTFIFHGTQSGKIAYHKGRELYRHGNYAEALSFYERAIRNNPTLRLVPLKNKRQLKPYIRPVLTLMNETFQEIYAFAPLSQAEMDEFARRYMIILDPRFIKIIENDKGELV
ncbi:MAG: tetratricopeptide repeat protein, partial [Candidatus Moranbacteria bacterium]|nr:tetratricopeptide repeat protein [Candidatus Moranbacteria bacterium]